MKKLLLASIILMKLALNAQSSVYKPFCNNPSWTVVTENFGMASYTTYQYQTDTIIGTYSYKKSKDISGSSFVLFREDIAQKKKAAEEMNYFISLSRQWLNEKLNSIVK